MTVFISPRFGTSPFVAARFSPGYDKKWVGKDLVAIFRSLSSSCLIKHLLPEGVNSPRRMYNPVHGFFSIHCSANSCFQASKNLPSCFYLSKGVKKSVDANGFCPIIPTKGLFATLTTVSELLLVNSLSILAVFPSFWPSIYRYKYAEK